MQGLSLKAIWVMLGLSLIISGCQAASSQTFATRVRNEEIIRESAYAEATSLLDAFEKEPAGTCKSLNAYKVETELLKLTGQESMYYNMKIWGMLSRVQKMKWDIQFRLAETALKQKCPDIADRIYREIVANYTGASYAGIRDRARIGLDDVREARRGS